MIGNLREQFLYERLPAGIITQDERGYIEALVSGYQDRLEDVRSFAKKLDEFWVPGGLPDSATANVVLVDLTSPNGKQYTRSLDIQSDTPAADSNRLPRWVASQLGVPIEDLSNVRYGYDALRRVDVNTLSWLAATLGTLLYQTDLMEDEAAVNDANVKLVETWFPRLKIKGTVQSFEVLGRILGFDDVRVTPLWTRLSPRVPDDIGDPVNDPDFAASPEYFPQQEIGPFYDPFKYRDGPFFSWAGTASNGTNSTQFYTETITGHNPWIDIVLLGSLAGTNVPAIQTGTVVHPASGSYALAGGAPSTKAYVEPEGSSIRFQAIADGADFNGLFVHVETAGTRAVIAIDDRLSAIKYRSSFFDLGLTADMDKIEDIFGTRGATTNKDLKDNPALTSDGTAVSPYRPWVDGSFVLDQTAIDWVTSGGDIASTVTVRREADPSSPYSDRQLNMDEVVVAGVQTTQAFEEVRAATRLPRHSLSGVLIDDDLPYALYECTGTLFTTNGSFTYSGTGEPPAGEYTLSSLVLSGSNMSEVLALERQPGDPDLLHFASESAGVSGSYRTDTDAYWFVFEAVGNGTIAVATWLPTTTELIRDEPEYSVKADDNACVQERPEDESNGLVYEVADCYPWRREVVIGGELVELDTYQSGSEIAIQVVEEVTAFNDHTGVDLDVFGITSTGSNRPRMVSYPRSTAPASYRPGYLAIGYSGTIKSLADLTDDEIELIRPPTGASFGDTETDYDVLFEPGYALYHVGLAQGVLVADLVKFFGAHHADGLVGWFPFNEHVDDDLTAVDHSFHATPTTLSGVVYSDRVWDDERGWHLELRSSGSVVADEYRDITDEMSVSFWIKASVFPAGETNIVTLPPVYFTLNGSGSVTGYAYDSSGTAVLVGSAPVDSGTWTFVYLRRDAFEATFGIGTLSASGTETALAGDYATAGTDTLLTVACSDTAAYGIHDLRVWNVNKTQDEMDLVRYHAPNNTLCTYRLGFAYTMDRQDKYGLKILPCGWASLDVLPAWYRRTRQGYVLRYDSMGSYHGETRFKEVGVGDHRAPPDTYLLGQQFVTMVAEGTAPYSTDHGQLPGWNEMWQMTNYMDNYDVLPNSGSTATGIVPVSTSSGTTVSWPNTMAQTNPFRQYVYVNATNGSGVYQLSIESTTSGSYLVAEAVVHGRSLAEIILDPYIAELYATGSVYEAFGTGFIQGTLYNPQTGLYHGTLAETTGSYGYYDPTTTTYHAKVFTGDELFISDMPTGAYTLLTNGTGILMAEGDRGVTGVYAGTILTPAVYMYANSMIVAQEPDASNRWTARTPTGDPPVTTPEDNDVDLTLGGTYGESLATVNTYGTYLNTPVLGRADVFEFEGTGPLVAGPHELTINSGQIGQADVDFDGFAVEINVNDTIFQRRLLRGKSGYNFSGRDTFQFDLEDSIASGSNYLLTMEWTNPAEDTSRGTKRQLAIFGYTLRHITTQLFHVEVAATPPQITQLIPDPNGTPGGWFTAISSYGTKVGDEHESEIYRANDTITAIYPLGDTLTGHTNERRNDVIYTGTEVVVPEPGSFTFPSFGSAVGAPAPTAFAVHAYSVRIPVGKKFQTIQI